MEEVSAAACCFRAAAVCDSRRLVGDSDSFVVCVGVAGGLEPALLGDVVIGSGLIAHGFGQLRAEGFVATPTEPPFLGRVNRLFRSKVE